MVEPFYVEAWADGCELWKRTRTGERRMAGGMSATFARRLCRLLNEAEGDKP